MARRMWIRLVFALTVAAFASVSLPLIAQTSFLIYPKPEKKWMQYYYRGNGAAPAPKPSTLMEGGTAVGFTFTTSPDTSSFLTGHPAYNDTLLGDLTGKTLTSSFRVNASGPFTYYGAGTPGNPCPTPANVRLYFSTNNPELGESQYWWSNPESRVLLPGDTEHSLNANFNPASWSDRDGHFGTFDPAHQAAFFAAAGDVQHIGLSFGGGCFFANGVGNPDGATFALRTFSVN